MTLYWPPLRATVQLGLGLLLLLTAGMVAAKTPEPDAREAFDGAVAQFRQSDLRAARISLMNAVAEDADWAEPHVLLAQVSLELFDPIAARSEIDRALRLRVSPDKINHLLGHALWLQGENEAASNLLSKGPIAAPFRPYAMRILGRVRMDLGDFPGAGKALDEAIAADRGDSMAWTDVARYRFALADQGGAIAAVEEAIKLNPNNVRALELRGQLVRSQFGLIASLPWFERALQVNPGDIPALEEYAATLGEAGRHGAMLEQVRKIVAIDGANSRAFYMQAVIAARARDYPLARRLIQRIGGEYAERPGPMLLSAIVEYELGNWHRAIDALEKLMEARRYDDQVRIMLARARYRSGEYLDAWDALAPIANRSDASQYVLHLAARILQAADRRGDAVVYLDRAAFPAARAPAPLNEPSPYSAAADAANRNPNSAPDVLPYLRLLLARGESGAARAAAARLAQGNETVPDAQLLLGDAERAAGNDAAALAAYERARAIRFTEPLMLRMVAGYRSTGKGDAARKTLADFAAFNPSSPSAMRLVAYDFLDRSEWGNALPWLLRLRSRIGYNDAVLNANLARAYSGLGRHAEAKREAALAYKIDPANLMVTHVYGQVLLATGKDRKAARSLLRKANKMAPSRPDIRKDYEKAQGK